MTRINFQLLGLIFSAYFISVIPTYSQNFEWCKDGFNPAVNSYLDIDGSGINLDINGLFPDYRTCYNNEPYIATGINNNGINGVKHNYEFSFSELVDVEFTIYDINTDSTSGFHYYDFLKFTPTPSFSNYTTSITIKGDTILPKVKAGVASEVRIKYKSIKSFSIQHGLGKGYNPGYILLSSLIINGDKLGKPKLFNQISYGELVVFKQNTHVRTAYFIASTGQLVKSKFKSEESGTTRISTSELAAGIYVVFVEFESGDVLKEKVMVLQ